MARVSRGDPDGAAAVCGNGVPRERPGVGWFLVWTNPIPPPAHPQATFLAREESKMHVFQHRFMSDLDHLDLCLLAL